MSKKLKTTLSVIALVVAVVMALTGCAKKAEPVAEPVAKAAAAPKIAILTGTVSQGEEEYRAAQKMIKAFGADRIITDTYPDKFMAEQETTVSKLLAFASDPDVKAIVMCQAVPGAKAAFDKIREMGRKDILLIAGAPQEDPAVISAASNIIMYSDEISQGDSMMETCAKWGVEVFIHYSFPRHMAMELIVARHALLQKNADALGIKLVDRTAPDPTAEAGLAASQQFILEDVPKVMEEYKGKKIAFFTTNCGMQEPLQVAVLAAGANAFYPQPCCPSPYHAFPASLSLVAGGEQAMDIDPTEMLKKIATKLKETNSEGRFSTWPVPVNMAIVEIGVNYAMDYFAGKITSMNDAAALKALCEKSLPGAKVTNYKDANGTEYANYYTIMLKPVDFKDYL